MPTIGHPSKTITIPPKNASEDLIFLRCTKKRNVRSKPIIHAKPHINNICGTQHAKFELNQNNYTKIKINISVVHFQ